MHILLGIGFLGAGIILKFESKEKVSSVTTAANIWYAAASGSALGFNKHFIAIVAVLYAKITSRIPHIDSNLDD